MTKYKQCKTSTIVFITICLSALISGSRYEPLKCGKPTDLPCLENLVKFCRGGSRHLDLIIGICTPGCVDQFCFKTSGSHCCNWYHSRCRRNRFEGCNSISGNSCSKPFVKILCPTACGICNRVV